MSLSVNLFILSETGGGMTHKPGTVNVRIDGETLKRIADKKAHLKLARQTASFPTIDEVINAALDALEHSERERVAVRARAGRGAEAVQP